MKRTYLLAVLVAAGFGVGSVHAQQSDSSMPDQSLNDPAISSPSDSSMGEATAEQGQAYDDEINVEGPEERLHGQRDGDMEGETDNLRDDQLERAPTGGAGSAQSAEQPQIPDQSLGSVGHPTQAETTGQGSGLDEQPASAEGEDMSKDKQQQ